ncbi:ATP-binding protein [Nocardiopsis exhalans]|uniref:ATP-binding protein n=1 Tax=Nocardiopsis exhalans TaxID=163604 RepID=A0ABY5D8X1_9ACTN|nr:ATP-binding protein [Nocardiopsis exhalans]USY19602.1 ATP-binding protein [Nocardiopsis exhalans]
MTMTGTVLAPPSDAATWWDHRSYPADPAQVREVRRDLDTDLSGFDADLVATVRLCAAELAANAVKYAPGAGFHRALAMPTPAALWLAIIDGGAGTGLPRIPTDRTDRERDDAEGQRGLVLVDALATTWGHYPTGPGETSLGLGVWASFTLRPGQAPAGLGRLIMTR